MKKMENHDFFANFKTNFKVRKICILDLCLRCCRSMGRWCWDGVSRWTARHLRSV